MLKKSEIRICKSLGEKHQEDIKQLESMILKNSNSDEAQVNLNFFRLHNYFLLM